jgi:hypothetical protein
MAKKKAKVKTDTAANDLIKLIHPDIGWDEPDDEGAPATKQDGPDYAAMLAAMQGQVATMQSQMETLHRTNMALMAQPVNAPVAPKVQEFSMEGLPDPALQPSEYAREVNRRVQESIRSQQAFTEHQRAQTNSAKGTEEALWERFQEVYADYASAGEDKIRFVAEKVVAQAQKRGLDVNKYVTGAQDVFMADVAKEYDNIFGKPGADDDDDDDDDDSGDVRTAGMFGGVPSGGRPTTGDADEDDMFTMLRKKKIKEGWY